MQLLKMKAYYPFCLLVNYISALQRLALPPFCNRIEQGIVGKENDISFDAVILSTYTVSEEKYPFNVNTKT